jgi:hypothetical protein
VRLTPVITVCQKDVHPEWNVEPEQVQSFAIPSVLPVTRLTEEEDVTKFAQKATLHRVTTVSDQNMSSRRMLSHAKVVPLPVYQLLCPKSQSLLKMDRDL